MKHTMILIDDDESVLVGLTNVLQSEGYNVIPAADGMEARCRLSTEPQVDLILLDLELPDTSGWDLLQYAAFTRPLVPVVIITARPDQYRAASNARAAALLEKPLDIPALLTVVAELLRETTKQRMTRAYGKTKCLHHSANTPEGVQS